MFVHTFGAFFGLAATYFISPKSLRSKDHPLDGSDYRSDLFAMIGTAFLWMFWPSFNGALAAPGGQQLRVTVNTVLALCGSCVSAFITSRMLRHGNKFDMVDIQNATLAGGVAVGSSADLVILPWAAVFIGCIAGCVSVAGYVFVTPRLNKLGIHDTCGVLNLHGVPGLIGGISGAISAAAADTSAYGAHIGDIFPARSPSDENWTASEQAWHQTAALFVTVGIAVVGGAIVGKILSQPVFNPPTPQDSHSDRAYWEVPEDFDDFSGAVAKQEEGAEAEMINIEMKEGVATSESVTSPATATATDAV